MRPEYWVLVIMAAALVYEFAALIWKFPTISQLAWRWSVHPMFPLTVGILIGHWFWPKG